MNLTVNKVLANNYNELNKMLHAPEHYGRVTNWPIRSGDWNMDQFGKICYRDSIELTVDSDKVTVDKKPLFMLNNTAKEMANRAIIRLTEVYNRFLSYDRDAQFTLRTYTPEQIEALLAAVERARDQSENGG